MSISLLLWIMLQWTLACRYLLDILILFSLAIYPEVNYSILWWFYFLTFRGSSILISIDCINLHFYQQWISVPFYLHSHQHLLSFEFLLIAILIGVRGYLIVVLICFSLMISDVEHFFIYLLAICMSSLEKCLFRSLAYFLIALLVLFFVLFCYWVIWFPYILDINLLSDIWFANVFCHSVLCLFTLLIVSFTVSLM